MKKGFTLVELMVSVGIFLVITAYATTNMPYFTTRLSLELLAHDIALAVREAQSYTLGVKSSRLGGEEDFPSYGVRVSVVNNKEFILFADKNGNQGYDEIDGCSMGVTECETKYSILGQNLITRICAFSTAWECSTDTTPITYLDLVFERPEPDALIFADSSSSFSQAEIEVTGVEGLKRYIQVYSTGQIAVASDPQI